MPILEQPSCLCYNEGVGKERRMSGSASAQDRPAPGEDWPGPADVEFFTAVQAGSWGDTLRAFVRFVDLTPGLRVLDAGTGPGLLARLVAQAGARSVAGCDDSTAMLRRAQQLTEAEGPAEPAGSAGAPAGRREPPVWVVSAVQRLAFAGGAFDAALATNLLFLLPDPAAGLRELVRAVRPGGCVAFLNPSDRMNRAAAEAFVDGRDAPPGIDRFSFLNYARIAEEHQRLSEAAWRSLAEAAGLGDLRTATRAGGMVLFLRGIRR
jgi:SAM-dependent methyltransferase